MTSSRSRVEVKLSPDQLQSLDAEAQRLNVSKAVLLRQWAFDRNTTPPFIPKGKRVYAEAVESAARSTSGISRIQLEAIVAAVIISLKNA